MYGIIDINQERQSKKDYYICLICQEERSTEDITRRPPKKNHIYGHILDQIEAPDTPTPLIRYEKYELEDMVNCYNKHENFKSKKKKKIQFHRPETEKQLNKLHH